MRGKWFDIKAICKDVVKMTDHVISVEPNERSTNNCIGL